jgi:hypothetical protein
MKRLLLLPVLIVAGLWLLFHEFKEWCKKYL